MFDQLEDLVHKYADIMNELNGPHASDDQKRFQALRKEQNKLAPIVEAYRDYKKSNQDIEDSLAMLEEENDAEMREMLKEELNDAKGKVAELEEKLRPFLKAVKSPKAISPSIWVQSILLRTMGDLSFSLREERMDLTSL